MKNEYKLVTYMTHQFFDIEKLANKNPDLYNELCEKYPIKKNGCVYAVIYKKEQLEAIKDDESAILPPEKVEQLVEAVAKSKTAKELADDYDKKYKNEPMEGTECVIGTENELVIEVEMPLSLVEKIWCEGSHVRDGKLRIYHYVKTHTPSNTDLAKFLSNEYGLSGWSGPGIPSVHNDTKGMRIDLKDGNGDKLYKWTDVAKGIKHLIDINMYLTNEELETYNQNPTKYIPVHNKGADDEEDESVTDDLPDEAYEVTEELIADNQVVHSVDFNLTTLEGVLAYFTTNGYADGNKYDDKIFTLTVEEEIFDYLYNGRISRARYRLLKLNDFYFVVEGGFNSPHWNAPYLTDKTSLKDVEYKYIPRQKTPLYPENFAPLFNIGETIKVEYNLGRNKETLLITGIELVKDHDNLIGYAYDCTDVDTGATRMFLEDKLCEIEVE